MRKDASDFAKDRYFNGLQKIGTSMVRPQKKMSCFRKHGTFFMGL